MGQVLYYKMNEKVISMHMVSKNKKGNIVGNYYIVVVIPDNQYYHYKQ